MTNVRDIFADDLGDDLRITKTTRRGAGSGTWVFSTIAGYRFDALVFPEHVENAEWELGDSRISKLSIARLKNKETVFNWTGEWTCPPHRARRRRWLIFSAPAWPTTSTPTNHQGARP